jgi:hypothetical protein
MRFRSLYQVRGARNWEVRSNGGSFKRWAVNAEIYVSDTRCRGTWGQETGVGNDPEAAN